MSDEPHTLLDAVTASLRRATRVPDGEAPPVAVLWTDPKEQWQPLIKPLRAYAPAIYTLGDYAPDALTGPVIWLKCIVSRVLADVSPAPETTPVLYLPGVARATLRDAAGCPEPLQPLVELCYRGTVWHQRNGRDWTVPAFLESELELDLARDRATREALFSQLERVAREPLATFRDRRVDSRLLLRLDVTDPVDDLLTWMCDPGAFRERCDDGRWHAFRQVCVDSYGFDPENDGVDAAGEKLLNSKAAAWNEVWHRFCRTPHVYAGLSKVLRMSIKDLFPDAKRSPGLNERDEDRLRDELAAACEMPHAEACEKILALEAEHGARRDLPWAMLGESPLARALAPLADLARAVRTTIGGRTAAEVATAYADGGWTADQAALDALAMTFEREQMPVADVIRGVLRTLYAPWLDHAARKLQDAVPPSKAMPSAGSESHAPDSGTCVVFVDGLRYDVAQRLATELTNNNLICSVGYRLAPLPTVTPTAKPVAAPLDGRLGTGGTPSAFCPRIADTGEELTKPRLHQLLRRQAVELVDASDPHAPPGPGQIGWCETGQLDSLGHKLEGRLAQQIDREIARVATVVTQILAAGWRQVRVVTDHGWLLLPDGLPKVELPASVTASRWARCAAITGGATPAASTWPWYWDETVRIAMPPGAGAYMAGVEYAHGGISPQECVVPALTIHRGTPAVDATITAADWRGMRLKVRVETSTEGLSVDLRRQRNAPETSLAQRLRELNAKGEASLVVEDEDLIGSAATVVVLDASGSVIASQPTEVGDDR